MSASLTMKIKYKTITGEIITFEQAYLLDFYCIEYYENERIIKKEYYSNKQLSSISYYLDEFNDIVSDILDSKIEINYIKENRINSDYKKIEIKTLQFGVLNLTSIHIEELNSQNIIYSKTLDSKGNQIKLEKYFYEGEDLKYIFEYFENGEVYMINIFDGIDSEQLHYSSNLCKNFDFEGLEYYKDGDQIIPEK